MNSQNKLVVVPPGNEQQYHFFNLSDGRPVYASVVKHYSAQLGIRVRFSSDAIYGCNLFVSFEVDKVLQCDPTSDLTLERLQEAFIKVKEFLIEIGVETDIATLRFCRLDLFRDIYCEISPEEIRKLFLKYFKHPRKSQLVEFDMNQNFEFRNNNMGFIMYDRVQKASDRNNINLAIQPNKHLLRFELRFKNHEKILSVLKSQGIKNDLDVLFDENIFIKLRNIFDQFIEKSFFSNIPRVSALNGKSMISAANFAQNQGCLLTEFFKFYAMRLAVQDDSFDAICKIFYGKNVSGKGQYKALKRSYLKKEQQYGLIEKSELETLIGLLDKLVGGDGFMYMVRQSGEKHSEDVWEAKRIDNLAYLFFPESKKVANE